MPLSYCPADLENRRQTENDNRYQGEVCECKYVRVCACVYVKEKETSWSRVAFTKYTLNSEPKALTGDKSEGIKSRGAAEAFIRGFSPVKAEGEEFNVLILSYTRELSRPFKENKG